jgi:hypothetical protein
MLFLHLLLNICSTRMSQESQQVAIVTKWNRNFPSFFSDSIVCSQKWYCSAFASKQLLITFIFYRACEDMELLLKSVSKYFTKIIVKMFSVCGGLLIFCTYISHVIAWLHYNIIIVIVDNYFVNMTARKVNLNHNQLLISALKS